MDMIKIACLGLSGVMMGLLLRQVKSPLTEVVSLCTCLLIIFYSVTRLELVLDLIETAGDYLSLEESYFRILMKIVGITYIADFSAALCRDAGYSAVASQIEIFGKISILAVSSPILMALLETVFSFLEG